jgi:hypothetical protein
MKDDLPKYMSPAAELVRQLNKLFEDPHPGLAIWNLMVQERVKNLTLDFIDGGILDDKEVLDALMNKLKVSN